METPQTTSKPTQTTYKLTQTTSKPTHILNTMDLFLW